MMMMMEARSGTEALYQSGSNGASSRFCDHHVLLPDKRNNADIDDCEILINC